MESKKEKAISLVQPNKVTNARYHFSEREENILTLMISAIQGHMTRKKPIQTDLFNQPCVDIDVSEMGNSARKADYLKAANSMRKKDFSFTWDDPETRKEVESEGCLVTTVHNYKETSKIRLTINTWAIPYLLYWGKEEDGKLGGGTIFNKQKALSLRGNYTKRLYKLCCRWKDRGGFSMSLDEFREMMEIRGKYPRPKLLAQKVLDPARDRMREGGAEIYFEYELKKVNSRSYNVIMFKILSNESPKVQDKVGEWYSFIYSFLCRTWPNYKSDKAMRIVEGLSQDARLLREAYERFCKLDDELTKGGRGAEDVVRLTKHILKADFGVDVRG